MQSVLPANIYQPFGSPARCEEVLIVLAKLQRKIRNAALDVRHGTLLCGWADESPFADQGANPAGNSDYEVLYQVFAGRIEADDVLVDVGCGRGRVIKLLAQPGSEERNVRSGD